MEIPNLINKIESLRQELTALEPLSIERQEKLNKKFRLEFNYNSNHIEGNTLTYGETELYLIFDKTTGDHEGREYEEMKTSDVALKLIQEYAADKEHPLTESFIKNLNKIILVRPYWVEAITPDGQQTQKLIEPGDYKKHPNSVRLQNGEMFHYASPQETPALMGDLLQWYHDESVKKELHPVALAALLHYKFVRIHPFDDGNGRISRLLMNYALYYYGFPPVIIKSANKKDYLFALNKADIGDLDAFVGYIAQQMTWSLELSIGATKGEEIEEHDDVEKEISIWKKELKNKNPIDAIPKTATVIQKLYSECLDSLFALFRLKIYKSFHDLFNGWDITSSVNSMSIKGGELSIGLIMSGKSNMVDEFKMRNSTPLDVEGIYSIGFNVYLNGFKKNFKDLFNMSAKLEILFNENKYQIQITTPFGIKSYPEGGRLYNYSITNDEQQTIINNTIKDIFAYIKEHTETQV